MCESVSSSTNSDRLGTAYPPTRAVLPLLQSIINKNFESYDASCFKTSQEDVIPDFPDDSYPTFPLAMSHIPDYPLDSRLAELTVRDLPLNRRQQLSSALNAEQILLAECGLARDYRGIAQQLELPYTEMTKLSKMIDPFGSLLSYHSVSKLSVAELLRMIEKIGRFDVLDDVVPGLVEELEHLDTSKKDQLLLYDPSTPNPPDKIWYDAYVCYADSDLDFVQALAAKLESPPISLRLFIRHRDLLGGTWIYETFAQLIESQCRRVLVIFSPDFFLCTECAFQTRFATGLGIEKQKRILIPLIIKPCEALPPIIRMITKIDMIGGVGGGLKFEWALNRLVRSILDQPNPMPTTPQITFPPSTSSSRTNLNNYNNASSPAIIELTTDSFPSVPSFQVNSPLNTTSSTLSNLTIGDDDQKQLLSRDAADENGNRTGRLAETAATNTQRISPGKETWFSSIKRKMKVKL